VLSFSLGRVPSPFGRDLPFPSPFGRVGVGFQATSKLALIPNMTHMDAGVDGRWERKATTKGRRHTAKGERKHGSRDLERDVRLKEIK